MFFKKLSYNKAIIFLFLLFNIGLYFEHYKLFVSLSYLILVTGVVSKLLYPSVKIKYKGYLTYCFLFFLIALLSILWSFNEEYSYSNVILLTKSILLSTLFIQLLEDEEDIKFSFFSLAISSVVFLAIYISLIDFDMLGDRRLTHFSDSVDFVLNLNIVSIFGSFAFTYFLFRFFLKRNLVFIVLAVLSFIGVFLLGSRKSILLMLLSIILLLPKLKFKYKVILSIVLVLVALSVMSFIPEDYLSFVLSRFESTGGNTMDSSDQQRVELIKKSGHFINMNPVFGNGYYTFSSLNNSIYYSNLYSHNNFIEIMVGLGAVGLVTYYSIYVRIMKRIYQFKTYESRLFMILFFIILINHNFIVILNEKYLWILLSMFYAYSRITLDYERQK